MTFFGKKSGTPPNEAGFKPDRLRMVSHQIEGRGVKNKAVLETMRTVPRHKFLPEHLWREAYSDHALPIDCGQTISQPYIVGSMTEELKLTPESKVLEIGTGSGYQTAVLAEIAQAVFTVEYVSDLAVESEACLKTMGYTNIHFRHGDGNLGWPEEAPFDAIIVTAAAMGIPSRLVEQLRTSGRLVIPLEECKHGGQDLYRIEKTAKGLEKTSLYAVRFVPMLGSGPT